MKYIVMTKKADVEFSSENEMLEFLLDYIKEMIFKLRMSARDEEDALRELYYYTENSHKIIEDGYYENYIKILES